MKTLPKFAIRFVIGTGLFVAAAFYLLFLSARPPLSIDPATLAGDGSTIKYCPRTSAAMVWNNKVLDFHAFGWGPVVVQRYLDDNQLIWEYADGSITRMDRLCELPEAHRIPTPRGRRFSLW